MRFKKFGCSLLFFLAAVAVLFFLLMLGDRSPVAFWIVIAVLLGGVIALGLITRKRAEKAAQEAEHNGQTEQAEQETASLTASEQEAPVILTAEQARDYLGEEEIPEEKQSFDVQAEGGSLISAGSYIVGEDIPTGKYDFTMRRGRGMLILTASDGMERTRVELAIGDERIASTYRNMHLFEGDTLLLEGSLTVEVSRAKKLIIE